MNLTLAWGFGGALGAAFFGILWYTTRRGMSSERPAWWFVSGALLRGALFGVGFYFLSGRRWHELAFGLLGFFAAHLVATLLAQLPGRPSVRPA